MYNSSMQACSARFALQNTILCHKGALLDYVLIGGHQESHILTCKAKTYSHLVPWIKGSWIRHLQHCFVVDLHNNSDSCRLIQVLSLTSPDFSTLLHDFCINSLITACHLCRMAFPVHQETLKDEEYTRSSQTCCIY